MKQFYLVLTVLIIMITAAVPCSADIDPILLDEPHDAVFGCRNDIFIEFLSEPVISPTVSGRRAVDNYLFFRIEMLFLAERSWNGIDKSSFSVKHTGADGTQQEFPLDYAASTIMNLRQNLKTISDTISVASLSYYILVFDVNIIDREGWSFVFRPAERGSRDIYCEIEVPLKVR